MARRNQSGAEDIIDITSRLPWWVGVLLAIGSYVGLHSLATKGMSPGQGGDLTAAVHGGLINAFASLGQYLLPGLFGIGAVASFIMSAKRKNLHSDVTSGNRKIDEISWQNFELLIGEHFRRQGFLVKETPAGPDGGVDLILTKNNATYIVQCKHYKAYKVGVKPVRELLGVMASCGAAGGYVVTSGEFTADARHFAAENNIKLMDGRGLAKILSSTKADRTTQKIPTAAPHEERSEPAVPSSSLSNKQSQICPKCGSPMVVRIARKGSRAGQKFLGCTKYPECRFIKPLE